MARSAAFTDSLARVQLQIPPELFAVSRMTLVTTLHQYRPNFFFKKSYAFRARFSWENPLRTGQKTNTTQYT